MNINPRKLLNSKWTAVTPKNKEKHFIVVSIDIDDFGSVNSCIIEALMSKKTKSINWQELKDNKFWIQGWKS